MFPTTILTALLLALTVAASPVVQVRNSPITLSFSKRVNTISARNLLQNDRKRVMALKARAKAIQGDELTVEETAIVNQPVDNQIAVYIASVGVGSPPHIVRCNSKKTMWLLIILLSQTISSLTLGGTVLCQHELNYINGPFQFQYLGRISASIRSNTNQCEDWQQRRMYSWFLQNNSPNSPTRRKWLTVQETSQACQFVGAARKISRFIS